MKTIYILLLSITIFSCQNEKTSLPIEENSIAISSQLKTDKLQTFEFVLKNDTLISGKEGTKVWITKDLFENYSNGKITFELKEFYSKEDMILNGLSTVTDKDELLESSGMFYINFKEEGKQLKIKNGKSYKVEIPNKPLADSNIYYNDNDSIFRWELGKSMLKVLFPDILRNRAFRISVGKDGVGGLFKETTLDSLKIAQKIDSLKLIKILEEEETELKENLRNNEIEIVDELNHDSKQDKYRDINNNERLTKEEKQKRRKNRDAFFNSFAEISNFSSDKLGWINIDRILDYEKLKKITIKNNDKLFDSDYVIFYNYLGQKSLINHYLYNFNSDYVYPELRIKGKIKVIVYTKNEDKIFYDKFYIDRNSNTEFNLKLKETTLDKLKQELISN
ncbi:MULTISPECIES: hypothetical protein [unclassified Flavobacterium]|uniref:hypothetical protein n=1 Tax=unclassified Flavobacterium TaxID=196869 RepID=UPI001292104C|nr:MULTISPECIES: hypothetical protein [unclassified Flavobacterium]MQP53437.1 hypothetical protein [Flavobacterium sp. LMO9]MQP62889.1 hypothetical protein [Flavobacterium sp. LMO6]